MAPESPNQEKTPAPWLDRIPQIIEKTGVCFAYFYLLRVPIITLAALIGLALLPLFPLTAPLAGNLYVLQPINVFYTMIPALMLAWSILVVTRVVLLNGKRFFILPCLTEDKLSWWWIGAMFAFVAPLLVAATLGPVRDGWEPFLWRLLYGLGGLAVAYVLGCAALLLAVLFAPRYRISAELRFPNLLPRYKDLLKKAYDQPVLSPTALAKLGNFGKGIAPELSIGYLDENGCLYPGHWFSFLMLAASFLVFWLVRFGKQNHIGEESFPVPAIGYVLLALLVINWLLAMASFFLDRFRIPLLLPLVILCAFGNSALRSDHYFYVERGVNIKPVTPNAVLVASHRSLPGSPGHKNGRVVIVATAGGGIQAAAWTARVLTGLQEQVPEFANSIAALSAVSGGAVGTMFFMNQYDTRYDVEGFPKRWTKDLSAKVVGDAEHSSLDDVAWAMVYSDATRIFFPYVKQSTEDSLNDRGWALEQTWRHRGNIQANLSNWREGVVEGYRPAVIFNSTINETGEALLLATTDLAPGPAFLTRPRTFSELYPHTDLPVVTAVRLAATFPYVSPSARPISSTPEYHMVDGGYFDNYGVFSLLNWLDQALFNLDLSKVPDILFIQIRSFPSDHAPDPVYKGWFFQAYAPLDALFNVRNSGQLARDQYELLRFRERWRERGARIYNATFQFEGTGAPLSWAMNRNQTDDITRQWNSLLNGTSTRPGQEPDPEEIKDWLVVDCFFHPDKQDCATRVEKQPW